jgi:hypothetical protein
VTQWRRRRILFWHCRRCFQNGWRARIHVQTHTPAHIHTPYILTHDRSARTVRICIYTERAYTTQYISRARACKEFAVANSREMTRHPIHACVLRLERLWGLREQASASRVILRLRGSKTPRQNKKKTARLICAVCGLKKYTATCVEYKWPLLHV